MDITESGAGGPRLLFVVNVSWFFVSHRLPVARAAAEAGFEVHVAARSAGRVQEILDAGITFHDIPVNRSGVDPISELRLLRCLIKLYRTVKPDIVHHITSKPILLGSVAARWCRTPAIVNAVPGLGILFSSKRLIPRIRQIGVLTCYRLAVYRNRSVFIFQNTENMNVFVRNNICDEQNSYLIPGSGVDLEEFTYSEPKTNQLKVLLPARMLRAKGVQEFVAAANCLREEFPRAQFLLAGAIDAENPDHVGQDELLAWSEPESIKWLGNCDDMISLLKSVDIVCLPTVYGEGVPKALIEAAAIGRPIVTTNVPGCSDIVVDGENGLLVPPKDHEALVGALRRLMRSESERKRMGRNGRAHAESRFDIENVIGNTLGIYEAVSAQSDS